MRIFTQSTARNVMVLMVQSADHVTGATGLTLSISLSKDGGAFSVIAPTVTERSNGWYSIALTTSHTDTLGDLALQITASGADPSSVLGQVIAANLNDAVDLGLSNLDATISSRMATFTLPTNFSSMEISAGGVGSADIKYVNGLQVNGAGTEADPWGPV